MTHSTHATNQKNLPFGIKTGMMELGQIYFFTLLTKMLNLIGKKIEKYCKAYLSMKCSRYAIVILQCPSFVVCRLSSVVKHQQFA